MYTSEQQIINGQEYEVDYSKSTLLGVNKEVVLVCQEDCKIVGLMEIDNTTETVSVKYRIKDGADITGHYNYYELPVQRTELASWIINTHPAN